MLNEKLKAWHLKQLRYECSKNLYDRLISACEGRPGGLQGCDQDMVFDACTAEDVKNALREDVLLRGPVIHIQNGGQRYQKENKSVSLLRAYIESQRKIFSDLRLTPAKRNAEETDMPEPDEFDKL